MKRNLKNCKNNSGITLIALVITIIVLIILAGISLNLLLGDNGIIKKAGQAGKESEKASDIDKKILVNLLKIYQYFFFIIIY